MVSMKKVYYASKIIDVCFVADENLSKKELKKKALEYLEEEEGYRLQTNKVSDLVEIKSAKEIPDEWKNALIWGIQEEITVKEYFLKAFK